MSFHDTPKGFSRSIGQELLEPTRIYVRPILDILREHEIKGMANITGGGLKNLIRLKSGVSFTITDLMEPQPIFGLLQELGEIEDGEMYKTFNMGLGFAVVCGENDGTEIEKAMSGKMPAKIIGTVGEGSGLEVPELGLRYEKY
jgi:phosphoribosylformylglycinamidine cyclo-ligase